MDEVIRIALLQLLTGDAATIPGYHSEFRFLGAANRNYGKG
jgi:hypothetical protein